MNIVSHSYEWWEKFWYKSKLHFGKPREELLEIAQTFLSKNKNKTVTLIDVGSGNGRYALPLARLGFKTTAFEITDSGCNLIRKECDKLGLSIEVLQADILKNELSVRYDLVFSSGLLEEIPPVLQPKATEIIKSLCNEEGLLVLKYCLEISERGQTVQDGLIPPIFYNDSQWEVLEVITDPQIRDSIANIDFETKVRTETIIAKRMRT